MQLLQPHMVIQGRYEVVQMVGHGGMGAVYKARDQRLDTVVALKQTLLSGAQVDQAFQREAKLLAGLRHQSLPKVMDHFIDPAGQFLVMEFIDGDDLGALVERSPGGLPVARVMAWAEQLLRTLEYLHSRQPPIIHRDIKPQNLKLGEGDTIVLLDFGLAKGLAAAHPGVTTGSIYGYTQQYAPLEQIQGQGTDVRSDLFSAAGTLYHLLTGTPPMDALTRAAAIIGRQPDPLIPIRQLSPSVPAGAGEAIMAGLALHRDDRPVSAIAMRAALHAVTTETVRLPLRPAPPPLPTAPPAVDLGGSTWEIGYAEVGSGPTETIRVRFAPGGEVEQVLSSGPGRAFGRWHQQHDQVSFDINGFSRWVGTLGAHGMSGTASTSTTRWYWKAIRVA